MDVSPRAIEAAVQRATDGTTLPFGSTFLAFTVDDIWYADDDLDRSMDLLAICGVDRA